MLIDENEPFSSSLQGIDGKMVCLYKEMKYIFAPLADK